MTMSFNPRSNGPEMPGLNIGYLPQAFARSEASLRTVLDNVYAGNEFANSHDKTVKQLEERLEACKFLGIVAGVPIPTEIMIEARSVLDARSEVYN